MFEITELHWVVIVAIIIVIVFIIFVGSFIWYLNFYFNRYEPVYIEGIDGIKHKNALASRFCKIVISNTITKQCLYNSDNVGLWLITSNVITAWPKDVVKSLNELHRLILEEVESQLSVEKHEQLTKNLKILELALDSNLLKSSIRTPPYLYTHIYALWITRALNALNNT